MRASKKKKVTKTGLLQAIKDGEVEWNDLKGSKIIRVTEVVPNTYELELLIHNKGKYLWYILPDFEVGSNETETKEAE
jgi:hypothetical protein